MKKRSFKIATAFTGAAVATMGLGPTALAATALPTSGQGNIRVSRCSTIANGGSHWLHLYYHNDSHVPECAGYVGWTTAGASIQSVCGGNNTGWVSYSGSRSPIGRGSKKYPLHVIPSPFPFVGPQPVPVWITKVGLNGWSGHDACPPA